MPLDTLRLLLYVLFGIALVFWVLHRRSQLLPAVAQPDASSTTEKRIDWMTWLAEFLLIAFPIFAYTVKHRQWMLLSIGMFALLAGEHVVRSIKAYKSAQTAVAVGQIQIDTGQQQRWVGYAAGYGAALIGAAVVMYFVYSTTPIDACIVCVKDIGAK